MVRDRQTRVPLVRLIAPIGDSAGTREVSRRLLERRVKVALRWNRLAVAPPLTVTEAEIDEGLAAIDYALQAADDWYTG